MSRESNKSIRFDYTGEVQEFEIPVSGLYKLEVFGASGGMSKSITGAPIGGNGGYSVGYKYFDKGSKIYICVGGKGETCPAPTPEYEGSDIIGYKGQQILGGFNGGGGATSYINDDNGWEHQGGAGGGATHISTTNRGELKNYENSKSEIIIVAGGGGGGVISLQNNTGWILQGGSGGGLEGGIPVLQMFDSGDGQEGSWDLFEDEYKSTQTSGYQFGKGRDNYSGGGGGWYGGTMERYGTYGGSGYIGGVPSVTYRGKTYESLTLTGTNNGNGSALITLMQNETPSVYLGTKEISAICFGAKEIIDIKIFN